MLRAKVSDIARLADCSHHFVRRFADGGYIKFTRDINNWRIFPNPSNLIISWQVQTQKYGGNVIMGLIMSGKPNRIACSAVLKLVILVVLFVVDWKFQLPTNCQTFIRNWLRNGTPPRTVV